MLFFFWVANANIYIIPYEIHVHDKPNDLDMMDEPTSRLAKVKEYGPQKL